jgi:hypothetical protein
VMISPPKLCRYKENRTNAEEFPIMLQYHYDLADSHTHVRHGTTVPFNADRLNSMNMDHNFPPNKLPQKETI